MTKKEIGSFDSFRKQCEKGESAMMIGKDFIAIDKESFKGQISKGAAKKILRQVFQDILEIYWEQPSAEDTAELKKMIETRFADLLSKS